MKKLKTIKAKLNGLQTRAQIDKKLKALGFEKVKVKSGSVDYIHINEKLKIVVKIPYTEYFHPKILSKKGACPTEVIQLKEEIEIRGFFAEWVFIQPLLNVDSKRVQEKYDKAADLEDFDEYYDGIDFFVDNVGIYRNKLVQHDF